MMSTILRAELLISSMVWTTSATTAPPRCATADAFMASWLAWRALSAFWRTVLVNCSIDAAVSARLLACSSVRADRSRLPLAISVEALAMCSVPVRTSVTMPDRPSFMVLSACSRRPVSSLEVTTMSLRRSLSATAMATATARLSGTVMPRVSRHEISAPKPSMATAKPIMKRRLR